MQQTGMMNRGRFFRELTAEEQVLFADQAARTFLEAWRSEIRTGLRRSIGGVNEATRFQGSDMSAYYLDRAEVAAILWSVIRSEPTEPAPLHYQPSWRIMLPRLAVILISLSIVTVVLMWQFSAATSFPSAAVATLLLVGLLATVLHFSTPRYWRRPPAVVLDDMWYAQLLARYLRGPQ